MIDIDELLEEQVPLPEARRPLAEIARDLRTALANTQGMSLERASGEERQAILDLRDILLDAITPIRAWLDRIDRLILAEAARTGATVIKVPDGRAVRIEAPDRPYITDGQAMRSALMEYVHKGVLSKDEVDDAIPAIVEYRPNHTKLNALRKRGDGVRDAIEGNRTRKEGGAMKVHYPRGKGL